MDGNRLEEIIGISGEAFFRRENYTNYFCNFYHSGGMLWFWWRPAKKKPFINQTNILLLSWLSLISWLV